MTKTILVCGHGPGISDAVARQFGAQGFSVALVARSADKLAAAAEALCALGITAKAFPADLGDPAAVTELVARVRDSLGPITVVHWNAYAGGAGDLTTASPAELRASLDVGVIGLVTAVQAALPDLQAQQGAVLVTGGGLSFYDDKIDALAVSWGAMGLAITKAAQHKLVGVLGARLAKDNIYVGEVVVLGSVKGTAFDAGNATIEASRVAARFWELYEARTPRVTQVG
ncbi:MAG: SDR family NAD(P)-dependent oxidoreductase [Kofleriaceae bacterium]